MVIAKSKKLKPQMNNTIKSIDYLWAPDPEPPNNIEEGVPKAIFIPHTNSLPFEERHVTLEQPVKIGRNVYRATPSPRNTIFECRVLSRHHATLYYEKGHFYLVDNKSSNGTFINNRYPISKEQEPHEVFSGDVVQFGISVVENAGNNEKTTFAPVVALLKLYHPDGKEAKVSFNPTMTSPLHLKELYQLNNFVQEAVQRESALEGRLRTLRECVERTRAEAEASWELFVGEQRLLMRVHTLEAMLAAGKAPDAAAVAQLLNDKRNYQEVAQESLRAAHEQRLALEEALERRAREAAALHQHNCALRAAANNALAELQKLAARCERKMCAARLAISAAEEREQALRNQLPVAFYNVQNGEGKMLILSTDSNKMQDTIRNGTLEDAVRALPDYIKLLLPQALLSKVGIKSISSEEEKEEFQLFLKKNNMYNSESKDNFTEKQKCEDGVSGSGEDKPAVDHLCTDDEKQSRLNHESGHELENSDGDVHADNNANSTYSEPSNRERESPVAGEAEYANVLYVMAGLNEEIRALRERVATSAAETQRLRAALDELLAAPEPAAKPDPEDLHVYKTKIQDLQSELTRSTAAEEANMVEIRRLAGSAAQMQAELACRPTRADIDDLAGVVAALRAELAARDAPRPRADKAVETEPPPAAPADPPVDLSAEIDEMFRLDCDDSEDSESAATEVERAEPAPRLDDEARLRATLHNGALPALEEELVRAKERWAEAAEERARLAAALAALQRPTRAPRLAALLLPALLAALAYLLLPHLS